MNINDYGTRYKLTINGGNYKNMPSVAYWPEIYLAMYNYCPDDEYIRSITSKLHSSSINYDNYKYQPYTFAKFSVSIDKFVHGEFVSVLSIEEYEYT